MNNVILQVETEPQMLTRLRGLRASENAWKDSPLAELVRDEITCLEYKLDRLAVNASEDY